MAYDADYFQERLKKVVAELGGEVIVAIVLRSGDAYYVHNIIETQPGYVLINVWHDGKQKPIRAVPSNQEEPCGYHKASVPFDLIAMVNITATTAGERLRIGFFQ